MWKKVVIIIICILLIFSGFLAMTQRDDEDQRLRIKNTTEFPYSAIVRVSEATGFFIDSNHVLTSAHVVDNIDPEIQTLKVYPAIDTSNTLPFHYAKVENIEIHEKYFDSWRIGLHDIALLTLDRNLGDYTGWFEIQPNISEINYNSKVLELAGYPNEPPGDSEKPTLWTETVDGGLGITNTIHRYNLDTSPGQSGSPVWYHDGEEAYVLSLHTGSPPGFDFGRGTRINEDKYDWIRNEIEDGHSPNDKPDLLHRGQLFEEDYNDFTPNSIKAGEDTLEVSIDIKNAGTDTVEDYFDISFFLMENPPSEQILKPSLDNFDYFLGSTTVTTTIDPFESTTVEWRCKFPENIPSGQYYQLGYHIDEENQIEELDKSNNVGYFLDEDSSKENYFLDESFLEINSPFIQVKNTIEMPWPSFGGGERNSGKSSYFTDHIEGGESWNYSVDGMIWSSSAIGNEENIYFGSDDKTLYALDSEGTKRWSFETGSRISATPAIDSDGTIYISTHDGNLYAIYPDGTERWRRDLSPTISSSPVFCSSGTIYIGGWDNELYAVNRDGSLKWSFETDERISSTPALYENCTIYFGSYDGNLYAIEDKDEEPEEKWRFEAGERISSSPAIDSEGIIYFSSENVVYATDQEGEKLWSFETDGRISSSPSIGKEGTIYVGSYDHNLYAINPEGEKLWSFETDGRISSSPSIGKEGTIYVGSRDGHLYAIR